MLFSLLSVCLYFVCPHICLFHLSIGGELAHKNKLLLKHSLAFEKFNGTLVASQSDSVKEKSRFECSQTKKAHET